MLDWGWEHSTPAWPSYPSLAILLCGDTGLSDLLIEAGIVATWHLLNLSQLLHHNEKYEYQSVTNELDRVCTETTTETVTAMITSTKSRLELFSWIADHGNISCMEMIDTTVKTSTMCDTNWCSNRLSGTNQLQRFAQVPKEQTTKHPCRWTLLEDHWWPLLHPLDGSAACSLFSEGPAGYTGARQWQISVHWITTAFYVN